MPNVLSPALLVWIAVTAVLMPSILFLRALLHYASVHKLVPLPALADPDCMVVMPARNEQRNIARAVRSFPPDTVIVVDDGSTDSTAAEASKAGAGVLPAPPLPKGATGKSNACAAGAAVLSSRWILFADADTWYEPEFFRAAIGCAEANNLDFLSILLTPAPQGLAEHVLTPYAQALFFAGVNPKVHAQAAFCGQCMLVRSNAYRFIGGHGALLTYLAADVKLAALAERHRLKFALIRAGALGHMRFQEGYAGLQEGVERSAFRFMLVPSWLGTSIVLTAAMAALWVPAAALLVKSGYTWAYALALLPMLWSAGWYRSWRVVLAPLAVYAILPLLWTGVTSAMTGARVDWKGRTI